jgi:hypothetical protein
LRLGFTRKEEDDGEEYQQPGQLHVKTNFVAPPRAM